MRAFFFLAMMLPLILSLAMAPTVAQAQGIDEAQAAFQRKDYPTAYRLLKPLADEGDAKAQWYLGQLYETGRGVAQDRVQAYVWYSVAAASVPTLAPRAHGKLARLVPAMTPEQLAAARRAVRVWRPRKPENLIMPATVCLGALCVLLLAAFQPRRDWTRRPARAWLSLCLGAFTVALIHLLHAAAIDLGALEYLLLALFAPGALADCVLSGQCTKPGAVPQGQDFGLGLLAMYALNALTCALVYFGALSVLVPRFLKKAEKA
jgi:hypothetical protein